MSTGLNDPNRCGYCGCYHTGICSLVKALEYHPDGTLKRVEFHSPTQVLGNVVISEPFAGLPEHRHTTVNR